MKPVLVGTAGQTSPTHYSYSAIEKVTRCWPCLRQRLFPTGDLIAGPFAGEFGYELMQWQSFVRARKAHYGTIHVITYPGRDYIYEGCEMHYHDIDLKRAGYGYGHISPKQAYEIARAKAAEIGLKNYDVFETSLLCTQYHKRIFWKQEFRLLEEPILPGGLRDVAIHFRAVQKIGYDQDKNYSLGLARELVERCRGEGLVASCIGHPDYSICPSGAEDLRSVDLRKTVAAISSARIVLGENSGPMHLANLCGKPTVIFAAAQWRINYSLRWNPFRVPIYVAANDTVQPAPERLVEALIGALRDLRERTNNFTMPAYCTPAQPIVGY